MRVKILTTQNILSVSLRYTCLHSRRMLSQDRPFGGFDENNNMSYYSLLPCFGLVCHDNGLRIERRADRVTPSPVGIRGVDDYSYITRGFKKRGYSDRDIRKIMGGNFLRVWKRVTEAGVPSSD